jgi:hypothetical protein
MKGSLRRWGVPGIVALLLFITLWNSARGLENAVFGLYYIPIFAAALLFACRVRLARRCSLLWRLA